MSLNIKLKILLKQEFVEMEVICVKILLDSGMDSMGINPVLSIKHD